MVHQDADGQPTSADSGGNLERRLGSSPGAAYDGRCTSELKRPPGETSPLGCFFEALTRKKPLDCRTDTNLNRCLNLLDLTALGVGSTLGLGLYVLAGQVASTKAGPGVVISFALAALASAFSALCYAEFAGRVPRAGSAYAYSYITVGEFVAFVIGWNLVLEYVIGASSVARGFSGYLRFVFEHSAASPSSPGAASPITGNLSATNLMTAAGANEPSSAAWPLLAYLSAHFDWPSVAIIAVVTLFILFGVKESTSVTLAFTALNLLVVLVVIISSLGAVDLRNWRLSKSEVPAGFGNGGFLPYGWSGVLTGSATCFFGFIGFDTIASSAEEAKRPKRNVPLSILLSLFISFLAYMAIAIVQTLLWPYYDQNNVTILPYIFGRLQMPITYWLVLVGAIAGLASSQLGGMYPLPRILYSMANDKLIYKQLAHINKRLKLPVKATLIGSTLVALLSCLLDIQDLADMVSIGTLAAYSLVSLSVMILRYEDRSDAIDDSTLLTNRLTFTDLLAEAQNSASVVGLGDMQLVSQPSHKLPADESNNNNHKQQQQTAAHTKEQAPNLATRQQVAKSNGSHRFLDTLLAVNWRASNQFESPGEDSSRQSKVLIGIIVVLTILLDLIALCLINLPDDHLVGPDKSLLVQALHCQQLMEPQSLLTCTSGVLLVLLASSLLMLSRLPVSRSIPADMFQVPLVPLVPTLSILVNTFLMLNLSYLTWVRFTVWMTVGLFIYFTYGVWNSEGYLLYLDR